MSARLFGIENSNRSSEELWGKNQFNSSFPASLACYMRENSIPAILLEIDESLNVKSSEISIDKLFNTSESFSNIKFDFETKFNEYQQYCYDDIKGIDLVINDSRGQVRLLEVKLTVIPDQTTHKKDEAQWAPEMVIRPASTSYCALGMYHHSKNQNSQIHEIFDPICHDIQHWDSKIEINHKKNAILNALDEFQKTFISNQKPFLMQPIWKTQGKSPVLSKNAFDLIVWSDYALCRTFINRSRLNETNDVTRFMRSSARLIRILYELSSRGKTHIENIYTEMSFGHQSDKEFALSGMFTKDFLPVEIRKNPRLEPKILKHIILGGGEKKLSPERRFDQTIYFASKHLFDAD